MHRMVRFATVITFLCVACLSVVSCSGSPFSYSEPYEDYYKASRSEMEKEDGMAAQLAVLSKEEENTPGYDSDDYTDLLINDTTKEVLVSRNCFEKAYPASTTKVMTALLTMEYIEKGKGSWDDLITLSHSIVMSDPEAVASTLSAGDTVSVRDVFRTMMIKSANDCSIILSEYVSGSESAFVSKMNKRARKLGATHTHFVNTNGLHDDDHYTTAYDLYLIFREACSHNVFIDTISSKDYTMTYTNSEGKSVSEYMVSTNHYLRNEYPVPEGVVMFGGKTGTTQAAKSCLILLTENEAGDRFYSLILGSITRVDLYNSMTDLLSRIPN